MVIYTVGAGRLAKVRYMRQEDLATPNTKGQLSLEML